MYSTRIARHVRAPRSAVYRTLLDADAVARWRVPDGMRSRVHAFNAHEGGSFRVSLTYAAPTASGKSAAHTDTYRGHFRKLVPNSVLPADNETGTRMALANLARLVETP